MGSPQDSSTVEIANVAPALREDLRFTLQEHGGQACYLIEDEKNSRFFRVGIPEYTFISLLDGTTSIRDALAYTASQLGSDAFTERDAASICKWLIDSQLAFTNASNEYQRLLKTAEASTKAKRAQKLNPLLLRLPLLRPDRMVTKVTRWFGWWFSFPAFILWATIVGFGIYELIANWGSVDPAALRMFAPGNLLRLLATWTFLKVVHEFSHGIACKRFGGTVREAGVLMIVFAPIPYVDVTSAWRMPSKWRRIIVSMAGMYTELFFAAVAAIVVVHSEPGVVQQMAYNVLITASIVTLIFNANPLMRFDGYYMLSDLLEIPNLYSLGQQYTRYLARRYVMGVSARLPNWTWARGAAIRIYGIAALFWRIFVCASLILAASTILKGAGVVLAIAAALMWIGFPAVKFVQYLVNGNQTEKPRWVRFATVSGLIIVLVGGFLSLPEPGGVRAPALVRYAPLHTVRAPHSGFVTEILVATGETVNQSQPLLRLTNVDLELEVADMRLEGKQSETRSRIFNKDQDVAALQVERNMRDVLKRQIVERDGQLAKSTVVAPADGTIVTAQWQSLVGKYVHEGEELCAIGSPGQKRLEVSVSQTNMEHFATQAGKLVDVLLRTPGTQPLVCELGNVDPRASQQLPHLALAATNGGPLPVQPTANDEEGEQWQLVEPHFLANVDLDSRLSRELRAGQITTVRLRQSRGSLAQFFYRGITGWIDRRLATLR